MRGNVIAPAAYIVESETGNSVPIGAQEYEMVRDMLRNAGRAYGSDSENAMDTKLTTGQAARLSGMSPKTIARLIDSGRLHGMRNTPGGHRYVMHSELMRFMSESKQESRKYLQKAIEIAEADGYYDDENAQAYADYLNSFK